MYPEDDLLPLSAVSQIGYCPRRAGLILLEQLWADNTHTAEGTGQHERVHDAGYESRGDLVEMHSVAVRSLALGLSGSADCVELTSDTFGCAIKGRAGLWKLRPVEYKHGTVRSEHEYDMQLCAQAMCLEEMLGCRIEEGDLFYYNDHRRYAVPFTDSLRQETWDAAQCLHAIITSQILPPPVKSKKCRECSLKDLCMPQLKDRTRKHLSALRNCAIGNEDVP